MITLKRLFLPVILMILVTFRVSAGEVRVAVAANFTEAARDIAAAFERDTGHKVLLSFGSSGQLYAQISQAAPFQVFLSADQDRPIQAERDGLAEPGSRFTYAMGKLVLWSRDPDRPVSEAALGAGGFQRLAIANPATAPYGTAALQVLVSLGLERQLAPRLVQGNSIGQTYQFVDTGNAELGFVALAQLTGREDGARWLVPDHLYQPIFQDAVLLSEGTDHPPAWGFMAYLRGSKAQGIIQRYGYGIAD